MARLSRIHAIVSGHRCHLLAHALMQTEMGLTEKWNLHAVVPGQSIVMTLMLRFFLVLLRYTAMELIKIATAETPGGTGVTWVMVPYGSAMSASVTASRHHLSGHLELQGRATTIPLCRPCSLVP